ESSGDALRRVAAGLATPLARSEVSFDILLRQPLETHTRFHMTLAKSLLWRDKADGSVDPMVAAGQKPQALRRLVEQFGLRQDAAADRYDGICGEDERALQFLIKPQHRKRRFGLTARKTGSAGARQFSALRRFVNIGRTQSVGFDPSLVNQREPARGAGRENEFGPADHLNR